MSLSQTRNPYVRLGRGTMVENWNKHTPETFDVFKIGDIVASSIWWYEASGIISAYCTAKKVCRISAQTRSRGRRQIPNRWQSKVMRPTTAAPRVRANQSKSCMPWHLRNKENKGNTVFGHWLEWFIMPSIWVAEEGSGERKKGMNFPPLFCSKGAIIIVCYQPPFKLGKPIFPLSMRAGLSNLQIQNLDEITSGNFPRISNRK